MAVIDSKRWEECARQLSLHTWTIYQISSTSISQHQNCPTMMVLFLFPVIRVLSVLTVHNNCFKWAPPIRHCFNLHQCCILPPISSEAMKCSDTIVIFIDFLFNARQWESTLVNCDTPMNMVHNIYTCIPINLIHQSTFICEFPQDRRICPFEYVIQCQRWKGYWASRSIWRSCNLSFRIV